MTTLRRMLRNKLPKSARRSRTRSRLFETLEPRMMLNSDWSNPSRPLDVNNDLLVTPIDALLIINRLNSRSPGVLSTRSNPLDYYYDVNGDQLSTPMDALQVINQLNVRSRAQESGTRRVEGEAEPAPAGFISVPFTTLPGASGQIVTLNTTLNVGRAEFNEMGLFVVDGPNGAVNGVLPSSPDYGNAVFQSSQRQVLYSKLSDFRTASSAVFPAGKQVNVYVLQPASANVDPAVHLRARELGTGNIRIGWDEHASIVPSWPTVGDRGYDDATVDVHIGQPVDGHAVPVIAAIPDKTVNEQTLLTVQAITMDADLPSDSLLYSFDVAPAGATIDPTTGLFRWTPTEAQGPGNFEVVIRATDSYGLFDTEPFFVTVLEVNQPPVLAPLIDASAKRGDTISFTAQGTDPDLPANTLSYSLDPGAPHGATLDPSTGIFTWTIPSDFTSATQRIRVRVRDNGSPALSSTQSMNVSIAGNCTANQPITDFTFFQSGGRNEVGTASTGGDCSILLTEGDSFVVGLQRPIIVPATPSAIEISYEDLNFDSGSTGFVRDAFEIALVDQDGNSLVRNYQPARDSFFNVTEGSQPVYREGIVVAGDKITIGLGGIPAGTTGTLIVRLVNNDSDTHSSVKLTGYQIISSTLRAGAPEAVTTNSTSLRNSQISDAPVQSTSSLPPTGPISMQAGDVFVPPTGSDSKPFSASTKFVKSTFALEPDSNEVMMTPAVIDLNHDNKPEIVFSTFGGGSWQSNGVLRTISGQDGAELWSLTDPKYRTVGASPVAVGDVDNDGNVDIFALHDSLRLMRINSDGTVKWITDDPLFVNGVHQWGGPAIADVDGDGKAEIVLGAVVINQDGTVRWNKNFSSDGTGENSFGALSLVVDLNLDGVPEILAGRTAFSANGDVLWEAAIFDSFDAIGNFNEDSFPEIVAVTRGNVYLLSHLGEIIWGPVAIPGGGAGGAPTIADFDNDGFPEIGVAGANRYAVLETDGTIRWQTPTQDGSSAATGSSVFDFDGDGAAEVVYADETHLRVYAGSDGKTLYELLKSSCTTFEYPVVVDVDGDGKTEIVAAANRACGFGSQNGIYVLENDDWVPTRPIWNQHTYHITNINDDGSIPAHEANGWEVYNNYRRNQQPTGTQFGRPLLNASAANSRFAPGELILISGNAVAQGKRSDGSLNAIDLVSIDGNPADQLDVAGGFLSLVAIQPGKNDFEIVATDAVGQTTSVTLTIWGVDAPANGIDVDSFADTTDAFSGVYGRTSFDEANKLLFVDLATRNDGVFEARTPLLVGVKNITDPTVSVVGFDGYLPDGTPYFDYTDRIVGGRLAPTELSESPSIAFLNPNRNQFQYELVFLSQINQPPAIQTVPKIEAFPGKSYTYDVNATDPDGDALTYSLTASPAGMTINATTGVIAWQPIAANLGTVPVGVEVSDRHGGTTIQNYVISVSPALPNRPPVILSTPVTQATVATGTGIDPAHPVLTAVVRDFRSSHPDFEADDSGHVTGLVADELGADGTPTWVGPAGRGSISSKESFDQWFHAAPNVNASVTIELPLSETPPGSGFFEYVNHNFFPIDGELFGNENLPNNFHFTVQTHSEFIYRGGEVFSLTGDDDIWVFINNRLVVDLGGTHSPVSGSVNLDDLGLNPGTTYSFDLFFAERHTLGSNLELTTSINFGPPPTYSYPLNAIDPDSDALTHLLYYGPEGLTVNRSNGLVLWSPTPDQVGNHPVRVQVDDGKGGYTNQVFVICVHADPMNHSPVIVSEPVTQLVDGKYRYDVEAVDADNDQLRFSLERSPIDMTIDESSGLIQWTQPDGSFDVPVRISVKVSDQRGGSNVQELDIQKIPLTGTISGTVFTGESAQRTPQENVLVYLDQNNDGVRNPGETVRLTDANGDYAFTGLDAATYVVREEMRPGWEQVHPGSAAVEEDAYADVVLETFNPGGATYAWPYGRDVESFGYNGPVNPNIILGPTLSEEVYGSVYGSRFLSIPEGYSVTLGFADEYVVDGPGNDIYIQSLLDSAGEHADIYVGESIENLVFLATIGEGGSEALDLASINYTGRVSVLKIVGKDSLGGAPGFDLVSVKALNRQPAVNNAYVVHLGVAEVSDGKDFGNILTDPDIGDAFEFVSLPVLETVAGFSYRYDALAIGPDGVLVTYSLPLAAPGMTIHPRLGVIAWLPGYDQVGTQSVIVQATDNRGNIATQSLKIVVSLPNVAPIITSRPLVNGVAEVEYHSSLAAQDADRDPVSFKLVSGPSGLTVQREEIPNADSGVPDVSHSLVWTPTTTQVGEHSAVVVAHDGRGGQVFQHFTITVAATAPNRVPMIDSRPRTQSIVAGGYAYLPHAIDLDGDRLQWSLTKMPDGMMVNEATGLVTWTPAGNQLGNHDVTVVASDGRGGSATQNFTLTISSELQNTAPVISSNPLIAASDEIFYQYNVEAIDTDNDMLAYSLVVAPRGMSIDPIQGTVRWQPDTNQFGENPVIVRVTDAIGTSSTQSFTVEVRCGNQAPAIISVPPTRAVADGTYLYPVRAEDFEQGTLTYRFEASVAGMSINYQTGVVSWKPIAEQIGTHGVSIAATDPLGAFSVQNYSVVVVAASTPIDPANPGGPTFGNRPPLITSTPKFNAVSGVLYQYPVTTTDLDGDAVTLSLTSPPTGMTIDGQGVIRWTPPATTNGQFPVTVVATDVNGATSTQAFVLSVSVNTPPRITSTPVVSVAGGGVYRYAVKALDTENDPLTYSLQGAPSGMTIDRVGLIRWQKSQADLGSKSFTVTVTDDYGQNVSQVVPLVVVADTEAPKVSVTVTRGGVTRDGVTKVDFNGRYTVQVTASDNVGVDRLSLKIGGMEKPLDASGKVELLGSELGDVVLPASATDPAGNTGTATLTVKVVDPASNNFDPNDSTLPPRGTADPADKTRPLVKILSPETGSSVTNIITVTGTVDDPENNLWYWRLMYARADQVSTDNVDLADPDWVVIKQSTTEVVNGELGKFDPTSLARDGYVIALVGSDNNGQGYIDGSVVGVEGGLQFGNFRLPFTDLTLPLAGIPISIGRIYDTLNANDEGDFGYGWSLGVQDARIVEIGAIGQGGINDAGNSQFVPDKTKVYLTNPDGKRVGFTYQETYESGAAFLLGCSFGCAYIPSFKPDPGVYDKLEIDATQVYRGRLADIFSSGINPDQYTLTTKDGTKYRYDQYKGLQTITDLSGNTVTFSDSGIRHSSGTSIEFVRDNRNRIKEILIPAQGSEPSTKLQYEYDAAGNLVKFTNQIGLVNRYEYLSSPAHFLDKAYDPLGRKSIEARYENRKFVGMFDALGNEIGKQEIDTANNTGIVRDANGNATTLKYDDRGNVLEEIDPAGNKTIREYSDPTNPDLETRIIDRRGMVTDKAYDSRGNVTSIVERGSLASPLAQPLVTGFTYNARNEVTSITNAAGASTSFAQNADGKTTGITNALGDSASFTYDSQGRRASFTDFNGNTTTFDYTDGCACGSPSKVMNPDGTYQTFEYNNFGQVTKEQTYEANGTLVEQKQTFYDATGRVIRELVGGGNDPLHPATDVRKFYNGNLLDWEIIVSPLSLNADGSLKESPATPITQRKSRITDYDYDAVNRLIRQTDAMGGIVNFRYDTQGNRVLLQDPVGNITTWTYDALNRVAEERDPFYWVEYAAANAAEFTGKTSDAYLNQVVIANKKPSGASLANNQGAAHVRLFGYDAAGNQVEIIDRNNRRREFSYDQAGRVLEERWYAENNGPLVETISYSYDRLGNLLSAENSVSKHIYTYDKLNRITSDDNGDNNPDTPRVILYYEYDALGNVIKTRDDAGVTVESTYNSRNQLATRKWYDAIIPAGGTTDVADARVDFSYNAAGRESQVRRFSDLTATTKVGSTDTTYDLAGRTDKLIHKNSVDALLSSYDYGYDFSGLLVDEIRDHQDNQYDQAIKYAYDLTGQLVDAVFSGQDDEHYKYDLNGNRISSTVGTETRVYTTGPANHLKSDGVYNYKYDGEGNLTLKARISGDDQNKYSWNHRNQLLSTQDEADSVPQSMLIEYAYDYSGRRVIQKLNQVATLLTVVNGDDTWSDYNANEIAATRYLYTNTIDQVLSTYQRTEGTSWYLVDKSLSVQEMTHASGGIEVKFQFSAFGFPVSGLDSATVSQFAFTSREFDIDTQLQYSRARYYDGTTGRFISVDPIGFSANDLNLYRYVFNGPTNATDPTGRATLVEYAVMAFLIAAGSVLVVQTISDPAEPCGFTTRPEVGADNIVRQVRVPLFCFDYALAQGDI